MNPSAAEIFPPSSLRAETTRYLSLPIFTRIDSQRSPGCRIQTALDTTPGTPCITEMIFNVSSDRREADSIFVSKFLPTPGTSEPTMFLMIGGPEDGTS